MKKEFSVIELACVVKEMQVLVGARITKVLQYSDKFIAFECFKTGVGRVFINFLKPGLFWFGQTKSVSGDFGFHKNISKQIDGSKISKISQVGSERIVKIDLTTADKTFVLYAELFNKGELILCNPEGKILCLWETQLWKDRELKVGIQYSLPQKLSDIFSMPEEDFNASLGIIDETVSKTLATELGLGGTYANELCAISGIDKNKNSLTAEELRVLYANLHYLLKRKSDARVVYENNAVKDIVPFPIKAYESLKQSSFAAYCGAIDEIVSKIEQKEQSQKSVSVFESKKKKLNNIIEVQKLHLSAVEKEAAIEQRKGEMMYENYQQLKSLLDKISAIAKTVSFRDIKSRSKEFGIKDFDDKVGDIVVEI